MIPLLHHVGIIMRTEEDAMEYAEQLGMEEDYRGYVPEFEALCIFLKSQATGAIELVVPSGGPLASYNRGMGGIHHYAIQVDSLDAVRADLLSRDIKLIRDEHVKGAGNFLCNFLDPKYTRGIMTEYIQLI
jgi:methylmalonyl-CoA epimerase